MFPGRFQHGGQGGQVDRGRASTAVALVVVDDFHHVGRCNGQIGHLPARLLGRIHDPGGNPVLGAVPVRGGEARSGREQHRPLPAFFALPVAEGQDHLLGAEEVEHEGDSGVERGVGRPLRSEELGHSGGRTVAEGVAVQVGQRGDDELAGQVQGLAGEVRGDGCGDARDLAVLDEEDAVLDRFVGGVEDGGAGQGEVLGGDGPGPRSRRENRQSGGENDAVARHARGMSARNRAHSVTTAPDGRCRCPSPPPLPSSHPPSSHVPVRSTGTGSCRAARSTRS